MADVVRPRINPTIYQLAEEGAKAKCVSPNNYIVNAIIEKAARDGFEIVDGNIISTKKSFNNNSLNVKHESCDGEDIEKA